MSRSANAATAIALLFILVAVGSVPAAARTSDGVIARDRLPLSDMRDMCRSSPSDYGWGGRCIGRIADNAHRKWVTCKGNAGNWAYNRKAVFFCRFLSNGYYWTVEWNIGGGEGPRPSQPT